jgi:hypothetical protein
MWTNLIDFFSNEQSLVYKGGENISRGHCPHTPLATGIHIHIKLET